MNRFSILAVAMKPDQMISRAMDFAAYCYDAAEQCGQVPHQDYLLSQAKKMGTPCA
jgi:hypothetical protein